MTQPQLSERHRRARLPVIWFTRHQNFAFANSFVSISAGSTQQQTQVHFVIPLVIVVGPQPDNLGQNLLGLCRFSMRFSRSSVRIRLPAYHIMFLNQKFGPNHSQFARTYFYLQYLELEELI